MNVKLSTALVEAIGVEKLKLYGAQDHEFKWKKYLEVDLADLSNRQIELLISLVKPYQSVRGAATLVKDCEQWVKALSGKSTKARTVKQFESLLRLLLARTPGHRVYVKDDERDVWQCYYVSNVAYTPPEKTKHGVRPAYAEMRLVWTEFGGRRKTEHTFFDYECVGLTPEEALARKGMLVETAESRAEYEHRRDLFTQWVDKVGKQFKATGIATDDCDGNGKKDRSGWWWSRTNTIVLDKGGDPARVVVDLFFEEDKEDHERDIHIDRAFWDRKKPATDEDDDDDSEDAADFDQIPEPEIPLHPMLACFDLRRHLRLRIDVGQLTEYKYDSDLGNKLVLPEDERTLVEMLLAHRGGFRDIVSGKSGGSVILCAGVPGTGKTLTAEVYAEVMGKPLYSVQASQLGTSPDDLEDQLLKTFARAARWGAILLLDEADVYVAARGHDLQQNAIVGVFLRVLEYYKGVLFLTTNRADLVDDAIASRCIARIDYKEPVPEAQRRIWGILSQNAGIAIDSEVIDEVVKRYPKLTGRDVKNLLKLATLVAESRGIPITLDVLRFVKRFKPTTDNQAVNDDDPISLPASNGNGK
jgi:hypothetical protein